MPTNLSVNHEKGVAYIESILSQWSERTIDNEILAAALIKNPVEKTKLLHSFIQRINPQTANGWLVKQFGKVNTDAEARKARRFLSIYLTNQISARSEFLAPTDPYSKVISYSTAESDPSKVTEDCCPEYQTVIAPLLKLLEKMQKTTITSSESRPGDEEIVQIDQKFKQKLK